MEISMKDVIRALKVQRRLAVRALKVIDSALAKIGGGVVRRKRRGKGKRKAKAKAKAEPKAAPKKAPAAPKPAQGESLADRKRKKKAALATRPPRTDEGLGTGTDDE